MFRFYKLYSLYMNNMASGPAGQREWCLCEKLPRAVLHIPVNHRQICQVKPDQPTARPPNRQLLSRAIGKLRRKSRKTSRDLPF
ncbi:GM19859 [Drosophila sechellia]|uniref:GM19859 n=1 Tax=Drosophila sechellia TaxID=7238 RepID=B4IPF0_DROSE|nr:GM19859 [Drosophila sechellia]